MFPLISRSWPCGHSGSAPSPASPLQSFLLTPFLRAVTSKRACGPGKKLKHNLHWSLASEKNIFLCRLDPSFNLFVGLMASRRSGTAGWEQDFIRDAEHLCSSRSQWLTDLLLSREIPVRVSFPGKKGGKENVPEERGPSQKEVLGASQGINHTTRAVRDENPVFPPGRMLFHKKYLY